MSFKVYSKISKIKKIVFCLFFLLGMQTNVLAYVYLYEFDTSEAILTHRDDSGGLIQKRRFGSSDKLFIEIDTLNKNIALIGKNSTPGVCLACPLNNKREADFLASKIDFRIGIFDFRDWRNDGGASGREPLPINFSFLDLNPNDLYRDGVWNYESIAAQSILEIAGASMLLNFSLIDGSLNTEYFDRLDPRRFDYTSERGRYLVSPNHTFFEIPTGFSAVTRVYSTLSVNNVGRAQLASTNSNAVPEPMSASLLLLGFPFILRREKKIIA